MALLPTDIGFLPHHYSAEDRKYLKVHCRASTRHVPSFPCHAPHALLVDTEGSSLAMCSGSTLTRGAAALQGSLALRTAELTLEATKHDWELIEKELTPVQVRGTIIIHTWAASSDVVALRDAFPAAAVLSCAATYPVAASS